MEIISHTDVYNRRSTRTEAEQGSGRRNRILWIAVLTVGTFACYSSEDAKDSSDDASSTSAETFNRDAGVEQNNAGREPMPETGLSNTRDAGDLAGSGQQERFDAQVLTAEEAGPIGDENPILISDRGAFAAEDGSDSIVEVCGQLICPHSRTCCNPSCGICTGPGETCTKIECDEPIGPYLGSNCDPSECGHLPVELLMCDDGSSVRTGCVHLEDGSCGYVESCPPASDAPCSGCEDDEYCNVTNCGSESEQGVCTPRPESCTLEYNPVCGCDYWTYDNSCMARLAGTDVYYQGECYF